MEYAPEEYTRHYIVQALFRLMDEYAYEKISVTDIARKAGVGRATFYRYFKSKEEVIAYYLEHTKRAYIFSQHYFPRCKEDYRDVIIGVLELFRENERPIRMLQRARLEYLYLNFLNKEFVSTFERDHPGSSRYTPYLYAGMLYNVSMAWLNNGCAEQPADVAQALVDAIFADER